MATGGVDTLECVLRKIGIADSEFTGPNNNADSLVAGDNGPQASGYGRSLRTGAVSWSGLYRESGDPEQVRQMIFACNGDPSQASMNDQVGSVRTYLNAGGRLFAYSLRIRVARQYRKSVSSHGRLEPRPAASAGSECRPRAHRYVLPKARCFAQWLGAVNALATTNPPRIDMNISRHDMDPLPNPPGTALWLRAALDQRRPDPADGSPFPTSFVERQNGQNVTRQIPNYIGAPQHYTFNTPSAPRPPQQCGRVLFSDFHVSNAASNGATFPSKCSNTALTPQEKVIEFMLFDLGNCITPDAPPPSCTPKTCAQLGAVCGPQVTVAAAPSSALAPWPVRLAAAQALRTYAGPGLRAFRRPASS